MMQDAGKIDINAVCISALYVPKAFDFQAVLRWLPDPKCIVGAAAAKLTNVCKA